MAMTGKRTSTAGMVADGGVEYSAVTSRLGSDSPTYPMKTAAGLDIVYCHRPRRSRQEHCCTQAQHTAHTSTDASGRAAHRHSGVQHTARATERQ